MNKSRARPSLADSRSARSREGLSQGEGRARVRYREETVPIPEDAIPRACVDCRLAIYAVYPGQSHTVRQTGSGGLRSMKLGGKSTISTRTLLRKGVLLMLVGNCTVLP